MIRDLIVVLGPARSYTSLVSAMLGQHPQLFGFPETHLLGAPTVAGWFRHFGRGPLSHGLLRLIAELVLGAQTESNVAMARLWLRRRNFLSTASVLQELAGNVAPQMAVEKSPIVAANPSALRRTAAAFPNAFYIHLTRHPLTQGKSMLALLREISEVLGPDACAAMARRPFSISAEVVWGPGGADPQLQWLHVHRTIVSFLSTIPPDRQFRIRGEDLMDDPDRHLATIAKLIGIRHDPAAIGAMKRPENSPFASIGPPGARFGADPNFLLDPAFRPRPQAIPGVIDSPLPWRADGATFCPEIRHLAQRFGYN